ncbi:MAG: cytochrome C oxidase subunit II [Deltaproteobacteria bacterium]|nr:cytochrome C oxidase subunit II [Deltaproteobacteria bacterium]
MFELLDLKQGSSYAGDIDQLIFMITIITGVWFLLTAGMFFWLLFRFRAKKDESGQYVTGDEPRLKRWVTWPHMLILVCDIAVIAMAINVWYTVKQDLPEADATIRIIAQQWAWTFVHPGPDGELDTPDDIRTIDRLYLQDGVTYHYKLSSVDVVHDFSVPIFRLKQDAVPGREITGWFKPTVQGEYGIQCAEMCGIGHGIMGARLILQSASDHEFWIQSNSPTPVAQVTGQ